MKVLAFSLLSAVVVLNANAQYQYNGGSGGGNTRYTSGGSGNNYAGSGSGNNYAGSGNSKTSGYTSSNNNNYQNGDKSSVLGTINQYISQYTNGYNNNNNNYNGYNKPTTTTKSYSKTTTKYTYTTKTTTTKSSSNYYQSTTKTTNRYSPTPKYNPTPAPVTSAPYYPPTTYPASYNYWDGSKKSPYKWTEDEINTLKRILYKWMDTDVIVLNRPAQCLRLTFHDCVGVCDGCLNPHDPNNEGLTTIIEDLGTLWYYLFPGFFGKYMSNADFWWLAGIVAVQYTTDVNNYFCNKQKCEMPNFYIRMAYGRTDCRTTPYNNATEGIPHAAMNYTELMDFYWYKFGMYPEEVTCLLGVHTCGSMNSFNSGFHGKWKEDINELPFHLFFDNFYYTLLTAKAINGVKLFWRNVFNHGISRDTGLDLFVWQFEGYFDCNYNNIDDDYKNEKCHATTMLPLDLAVAWWINFNETMQPDCMPPYCPISPMYWLAVAFSENGTFWAQEFSCVFEKMSLNNVNLDYMELPTTGDYSCISTGSEYPFINDLPIVVCNR